MIDRNEAIPEQGFGIEGYLNLDDQPEIELTFRKGGWTRLVFPLDSARTLRDALTKAIAAIEEGMARDGYHE